MKKSAYKEHQGISGTVRKYKLQKRPIAYLSYRLRWNLVPSILFRTRFPLHLDIEATNTCNLRCVMCPHSNPTPEFKKSLGFMDMGLYKSIIDEGARNGLCAIKLSWRGEPLMHPKLAEMIRYAKENGVLEMLLNTNAKRLDHETSKALIESGLDYIIFSFDSTNKETYEKIRVGSDFNLVRNNILDFIKLRNELGKAKPFIRMQLVKIDTNQHEVDDYIEFWKDKVDFISTQDYTTRHEGGGSKLTTDEKSVGRLPCPELWHRLTISWDGKVMMCCRDWESECIIGDLKVNTIREIWLSDKLKKIRRIHKKKQLDKIDICRRCGRKETFDYGS